MPNRTSVKKAHRSSLRKKAHNLSWKAKVADAKKLLTKVLETKGSSADILREKEIALQKALDKAAKVNAIHKNKARRLKSRYAKKLAAQNSTEAPAGTATKAKPKAKTAKKTTATKSKPRSKQKS